MRIECTYTFDDVRESIIPEIYNGDLRRYRRRWFKVAILWLVIGMMFAPWLLLQRLIPQPTVAASPNPPRSLSVDVLPSFLAAIYVWIAYVMAIWKTWRKSHKPPIHAAPRRGLARRVPLIAVTLIGGGVGIVLANSDLTRIWYPSPTQTVLLAIAPWAVLILLMQVLGALLRGGAARQQWLAQPGWRRPKIIELDENGYHISDAITRTDLGWSYFPRVRETPNLLVLIAEDGRFHLIPKRAFAHEMDLNHVRALLQNKIKETKFLIRPGGFAVLPKPVLAAQS